MNVTAEATRVGKWWVVEVPEVPGVFTQAHRLDQVEGQVVDAVRTMIEDPTAEVVVEVVPTLDAASTEAVRVAREQSDAAEQAAAARAAATHRAVVVLRDGGLSVRDAAIVLGLSHQRVAQIAAS